MKGTFKKTLLLLSLLVSLVLPFSSVSFAEPTADITVKVNDDVVVFDVAPRIINDRSMMQIRAIAETLGCLVSWDEETQTAYINQPDAPLEKTAKKGEHINVYVNNKAVDFPDQKPVIVEGYTFIPSRGVVEALGYTVEWDDATRTQTIYTDGRNPSASPTEAPSTPAPVQKQEPSPTEAPSTSAPVQKQEPSPTAAPTLTPTPEPAANPVSAEVFVTDTGKKYHRDGCRYLSQSKIPISLDDAKSSGYGPCSVCSPPQ